MSAFIWDFIEREDQIEIGSQWDVRITYYTDAESTVEMDWTGWTNLRGQIRASKSTASTLLLDLGEDDGCTLEFDDADLVIVIEDSTTADIDWQNGYLQVEADDPSGAGKRILEGRIKTNARVYDAGA